MSYSIVFFISKSGYTIYLPYKYITTNISVSSRIMHNMPFDMHIIRLWECFVLVNKNISVTMKINNGSQESSKPINYISHWLLQSREKLFVWHLSWLDIFVVGVQHLEIKWTMLYVYNHIIIIAVELSLKNEI